MFYINKFFSIKEFAWIPIHSALGLSESCCTAITVWSTNPSNCRFWDKNRNPTTAFSISNGKHPKNKIESISLIMSSLLVHFDNICKTHAADINTRNVFKHLVPGINWTRWKNTVGISQRWFVRGLSDLCLTVSKNVWARLRCHEYWSLHNMPNRFRGLSAGLKRVPSYSDEMCSPQSWIDTDCRARAAWLTETPTIKAMINNKIYSRICPRSNYRTASQLAVTILVDNCSNASVDLVFPVWKTQVYCARSSKIS